MKLEDLKVGMKVRYKEEDSVYEIIDLKYIKHMAIVKKIGADHITDIPACLYHYLEEIKPIPSYDGTFRIYQDKNNKRKIVAKYTVKDMTYVGEALCNPEDDFVFDVGATLAMQRALDAYNTWKELTKDPLGELLKELQKGNL